MHLPESDDWAARCAADGEFRTAARHWNGGLRLDIGGRQLGFGVSEGVPGGSAPEGTDVLVYAGPEAVWEDVLGAVPSRFHNDLMGNISSAAGLSRSGNALLHAQYYAAVARAVELLRPSADQPLPLGREQGAAGRFDTPVGRYVHLELAGHDHRIYFEEAGQGIPLLLQHTAGCHGTQWRHLFEETDITDRFRLIAYDLPFHGKSVPPVGMDWWAQPYQLRGEFLRSVPMRLAAALDLDRPVFMGCSVGGLLALDLAHKHADTFRAVISVEGALKIPGDLDDLGALYHPQISNDYKARLMEGLMAPGSPQAYRKETSFVYASGWPPAFLGDLYYYIAEFDLRKVAHEIDTDRVGVHILSGEYDYSGTAELGRAAHAAIAGSTWQMMAGVGHFPMSENPAAFINYVRPILDRICGTIAG